MTTYKLLKKEKQIFGRKRRRSNKIGIRDMEIGHRSCYDQSLIISCCLPTFFLFFVLFFFNPPHGYRQCSYKR